LYRTLCDGNSAQRHSAETQQSGHAPKYGPGIKMEEDNLEVVPKKARRRGSEVEF